MTYSEIQITFQEDLLFDSSYATLVEFDIQKNGVSQTLTETWVVTRSQSYTVPGGVTSLETLQMTQAEGTGSFSAKNFKESFSLDYGTTVYELTRSGNQVSVKSKDPNITFHNARAVKVPNIRNFLIEGIGQSIYTAPFSYTDEYGNTINSEISRPGSTTICALKGSVFADDGGIAFSEIGDCGSLSTQTLPVSFVYNNYTGSILTIDSVTFQETLAPCSYVKVKVTTSELAVNITSPFTLEGNTENPFYFDYVRGGQLTLTCVSAYGVSDTKTISLPKVLSKNNFSAQINNSPSGATVIVNDNTPSTFSLEIPLQYSLDAISWQTSNVFSGISAGTYTLYVKDDYGCSIQKEFTVDALGKRTPYFYISKSNAIHFAKQVTWNSYSILKND